MVYFDQIRHMYACQHCLTTGMRNSFLIDKALLSIRPDGRGQLIKKVITIEPRFLGSKVAYLFNIVRPLVCKTVTIISPGRSIFVKILITLEPHCIFCSHFACILIHFNTL